ncbi:MAG: metal-dependent hydrolase [Sphingomonadales bacterium]|nr:metal-dependent hydrolase [Sphingomonadales bacterium]
MPTIITHAIVPLSAAVAAGPRRVPAWLALAGTVLAMAPDLDVIGFRFGIAYGADWGHRGATHSFALAALATASVLAFWPAARTRTHAVFLFLSAASHGLLDMMTTGGLGVALFWPVETTRHFFAVRPIRVSPIGARFFTPRGLETVWSELRWVWLPCLGVALGGWSLRSYRGTCALPVVTGGDRADLGG